MFDSRSLTKVVSRDSIFLWGLIAMALTNFVSQDSIIFMGEKIYNTLLQNITHSHIMS
jgi:hypothetical protein